MKAAKEASAALLAGEKIGFYSEFPWEGELPEGLVLCNRAGKPLCRECLAVSSGADIAPPETGIAVTIHRNCLPFPNTVHVVPPSAVLGMGCRRGKEAAPVREAAGECLKEADIYKEALCAIAKLT